MGGTHPRSEGSSDVIVRRKGPQHGRVRRDGRVEPRVVVLTGTGAGAGEAAVVERGSAAPLILIPVPASEPRWP